MYGIKVMLHLVGLTITDAVLKDDRLTLSFSDGKQIAIFDDGQSCCEYRHMSTDDDLSTLIGHQLKNVEIKDGKDVEDEWGNMEETLFLEVSTDVGFVTLVNHNQHNGYYGGFTMKVEELS